MSPLRALGTRRLEGKRVLLRPFTMGDVEDMFSNWANDYDVTRYLTWRPHGSIEITRNVVSGWVRDYSDSSYHWAIEAKGFGKAVGSISVVHQKESDGRCEIGYCLGQSFWNYGLMTESVSLVCDYLLNEVGFRRIQATYHVANPAAGKVLHKIGFRQEGILRQFALDDTGKPIDVCICSLLQGEYPPPKDI